jgi:hypothetical protein
MWVIIKAKIPPIKPITIRIKKYLLHIIHDHTILIEKSNFFKVLSSFNIIV